MTFKQWLNEQGTKITATGLNSGGMAQHSRVYRRIVSPPNMTIKNKIKPIR
jgi:hypothetical protein